MPETRDLDDRIRELVARAVADAPAPPELDPATVPLVEPAPGHRRWWIGGGATLLAAAALVAAFVLVGNSDDTVSTPATDPSAVPTPAPTVAPTTTPATPAPTTTPPTTTPPASAGAGVVLTAGPEGVVEHRGTASSTLTTESMVIALDAGDGRVIVQRRSGDGAGQGWTDADTVPLVLAGDGSLTELFGTADWDGGVVLHDIEVVEGRRLLLFSVQVAMNVNPDAANETLYVVDLDTQDRTEVADGIGGWESGTGRLHLAINGLIVGEWSAEANHGIFIDEVPTPGVAAALPVAADLGLEESYSDCGDCSRGFTVAADGATFAWIDGEELVTTEIGGPPQRRGLDPAVPTANVRDLDYDGSSLVLSYWLSDPLPAPLIVPADDPSAPPTILEGHAAAIGAAPADVTEPPPPTTVPPSTTAVAPPPADIGAIVTAGPGGVIEHLGAESRTLTTEPMAIALPMGDANTLVQRHTGNGDGWSDADTVPLVLAPDGSLSPLFEGFDWGGAVVLHDIEMVDRRRLLLYSVQGPLVPQQPNETLHVIDLDSAERTEVAADIGGWEFGTRRLHLAGTGLVVGEASGEANHWMAVYAVPGSPVSEAAVPTAADLGLDESYFDCLECPRSFTVSPDGQTIGWVADRDVVTVSLSAPIGDAAPIASAPSGVVLDLDLTAAAALLSFAPEQQPSPVLLPLDGSERVELEGATAAFAPAG